VKNVIGWRKKNWLLPSLLLLAGCARFVAIDDPVLKPFASMYAVDRDRYGMTPLPKQAKVSIRTYSSSEATNRGYDAAVDIYQKAHHHVAFRLEGGIYKWVGEQEQCWGPREYHSVDGILKEVLTVNYFQKVQHHKDGLDIEYRGPDESLAWHQVPVSKAKELLKQWGCT